MTPATQRLRSEALSDAARTGRTARANGESLESELDAYHADLARRGIAWVRRVGTPVKVLGKVSQGERGRWYFRACFDGRQGCDFQGFDGTGRHVVLEAKSHAGTGAWDCGIGPDGSGPDRPGIAPDQWYELLMAEQRGARALVILRAWGGCFALTPDAIIRHVHTAKRRTIRRDEIDNIGRPLFGVRWGG